MGTVTQFIAIHVKKLKQFIIAYVLLV